MTQDRSLTNFSDFLTKIEFDSTCAIGSIFKQILSYECLKVHNMSTILRTRRRSSSMEIAAAAAAATAAAETTTMTGKNLEDKNSYFLHNPYYTNE